MEIRFRWYWFVTACSVLALLIAWRIGIRAHRDLVTLNVRNMEVRQVIQKIERQTWERILVSKDVDGKITLNVRNAPLEQVLELVAAQVLGKASHIYPIYRAESSLAGLQSLLQKDQAAFEAAQRWTNFPSAGGGRRSGFGGGPGEVNDAPGRINLNFQNKPATLAALTLSAASQALVVPEDGLERSVNLSIENATTPVAVARLAKILQRNWTSFYCIQAAGVGRSTRAETDTPEQRRERMQARLEALSPEQRAHIEALRQLTPEAREAQRQTRMENPSVQQQMVNRALNSIRVSTPEQIVQRKRLRALMAQQRTAEGRPLRPPFMATP